MKRVWDDRCRGMVKKISSKSKTDKKSGEEVVEEGSAYGLMATEMGETMA